MKVTKKKKKETREIPTYKKAIVFTIATEKGCYVFKTQIAGSEARSTLLTYTGKTTSFRDVKNPRP